MKKEVKGQIIEAISANLQQFPHFYVTDIAGLNAGNTTKLRRACFEAGVKLTVVKNTLFNHVLEGLGNEEMLKLSETLKGNTAIMYCETANVPGKLIKKFIKDTKGTKPELKGAYVQGCAYIGADKLDELAAIKSKEELLGDIIALLQSPISRVIAGLEQRFEETEGAEAASTEE